MKYLLLGQKAKHSYFYNSYKHVSNIREKVAPA